MDELLQTKDNLLSQITSIGTKEVLGPGREEKDWEKGKDDLHFSLFLPLVKSVILICSTLIDACAHVSQRT